MFLLLFLYSSPSLRVQAQFVAKGKVTTSLTVFIGRNDKRNSFKLFLKSQTGKAKVNNTRVKEMCLKTCSWCLYCIRSEKKRCFSTSILSPYSITSLLSVSDGLTVVLLRRMHPVIVKLPPLLGALSGPLVLFWEIIRIFNGWTSWPNDWTLHLHQISGFAYHRAPPQRSSQTRSSSLRETLSFSHLQPEPASAQLQAQRITNKV